MFVTLDTVKKHFNPEEVTNLCADLLAKGYDPLKPIHMYKIYDSCGLMPTLTVISKCFTIEIVKPSDFALFIKHKYSTLDADSREILVNYLIKLGNYMHNNEVPNMEVNRQVKTITDTKTAKAAIFAFIRIYEQLNSVITNTDFPTGEVKMLVEKLFGDDNVYNA